ncbi:TA system antitoxin ParD family protein [Candidatus Nucleicultrix amoebiphila]|jgi:hypothetical protein|uniref:ParD-like antitoxin of type II toxin-antitoxin system n=1 Tax=Candidatus Nucleicultrix amoebiphila FS5 TaxID=1414854 RepID=A0A1W6N4T2_9PROT|nr:hypothetical protein [Candidatus Nucleicultrix amoebiphila]ARN84864.1 hypothetical protein GQ61_05695 [Candidatus Nucleicultrix amoebiphila FS5]
MSTPIKLSDDLIKDAKAYAGPYHRSVPKQIEYWAMIGKIAEQNPDLNYEMISKILISLMEEKEGHVEAYKFD